jgi:hypothetical protein
MVKLLVSVILVLTTAFCWSEVSGETYRLQIGGGYSSYSMKEFNKHMIDEFWGLPVYGGYDGNYFASDPVMRIEAERKLKGNLWVSLGVAYLKTSSKGSSMIISMDTIYQRLDMTARAIPLTADLVYRFPLVSSKKLFLPLRLGVGYYWGAFRLDWKQTSRSGQYDGEWKYRFKGRNLGTEAGMGIEYFPSRLLGFYLEGQARYVKVVPLKDEQGRVWTNDLTANGWKVNLDLSGVELTGGLVVRF